MASEPQSTMRLVQVFETSDEAEAMVVQALLEANEIESVVVPLEASQNVLPGVGGVAVRVTGDDAEKAQQLIAEQKAASAAAAPADE